MFQEENRSLQTHRGAVDRKMENTQVFMLTHKPLNGGARARNLSQSCWIVPQTQVRSPVSAAINDPTTALPRPSGQRPASGHLAGCSGRTSSSHCLFLELVAVRRRLGQASDGLQAPPSATRGQSQNSASLKTRTEVIRSVFSDHKGTRLEISAERHVEKPRTCGNEPARL